MYKQSILSIKCNDFLTHQLKLVFWVFKKSSQRDDSIENQQHVLVDPLYTGSPKTSTLANSEDPDEMWYNTAFHQDLHCLLRF